MNDLNERVKKIKESSDRELLERIAIMEDKLAEAMGEILAYIRKREEEKGKAE